MSRLTKLENYPTFYQKLVQAYVNDKETPIFIPFETVKAARNFRLDFYGYRNLVMKSNEPLGLLLEKMELVLNPTDRIGIEVRSRDHNPLAKTVLDAIKNRDKS